jgi:serine protease Do
MKKRRKILAYLLLMAAGFIVGGAGGLVALRLYGWAGTAVGKTAPAGNVAAQRPDGGVTASGDDMYESRHNAIVTATQKVTPCVVGIVVTQLQRVGTLYYDDFFDMFFGPKVVPRYREVENMGSGVIIGEGGIILTNNHVVEGAAKLFVNFPDGQRVEGKIAGQDPYSDLAVVTVPGKNFSYVTLGNSDDLLIGEWVIAIGNPFLNFFNDPRPTVTVGVVSALNRNFAPSEDVYYQGMIQTDASINPGNSGGPLVNARGEVVGINAFIYTGSRQSKGSIGIGFAIPATRARRVVNELLQYGKRRQVWTGITVQDLDRRLASTLGIVPIEGIVVIDVFAKSPGEEAELRKGDVIVEMGSRTIRSHSDLEGLFLDYFVGDTVSLSYVRNGRKMTGTLVCKEYR